MNEIRVRLVTEDEQLARASGWHKAKGNWVVELFNGKICPMTGKPVPGSNFWSSISSHDSEEAAIKAAKASARKIAAKRKSN